VTMNDPLPRRLSLVLVPTFKTRTPSCRRALLWAFTAGPLRSASSTLRTDIRSSATPSCEAVIDSPAGAEERGGVQAPQRVYVREVGSSGRGPDAHVDVLTLTNARSTSPSTRASKTCAPSRRDHQGVRR